jgi:formylglycine-generating enzyme required for sulfatase activity/predicted Ser/Thr protein kinase
MPTIPKKSRAGADDTVFQPDADVTELISASESTQLMDGSGPLASLRVAVDVNTVLLGRFKLIQLVGEGGMSDVYKAIDLRKVEAGARNPHIAVKVMTIRFDDYFSSLAVMHQEASKLQSLTHANIVRVIDWDRDGQTVFMTMEYLDGTPLKFVMKGALERGLPHDDAITIISKMVAALEYAHTSHIVHGDLKPGNVILTTSGEVKVIDFGIARFLRRPQDDDASSDELPGDYFALTPPYASPEMHEDADPDPRDDVFALACISYELLVGRHPFNRVASTQARDNEMPVGPSKKLRPHELRALQNALRFDRSRRTPSARQFLNELMGLRQRSARRIALWSALGAALLVATIFISRWLGPNPVPPATLTPGQVFRDCPTCPLMVVIAPGSFQQGTPDTVAGALPSEQPAHAVTLANPIAAGAYEVTVGEYAEFAKDRPDSAEGCMVYDGDWSLRASVNWRNAVEAQTASHPITCVSYDDAVAYATWLSGRTHATYRLPTASEWEYLARGGADTLPWKDSTQACEFTNAADGAAATRYPGWTAFACDDRHVMTAPVGSYAANGFGLSDTLGNVFEWVQDCWRNDYAGAPGDGSAIVNADCAQHEARGGSWFTSPAFVRPAYRNRFETGFHGTSLGFRVVREVRNGH